MCSSPVSCRTPPRRSQAEESPPGSPSLERIRRILPLIPNTPLVRSRSLSIPDTPVIKNRHSKVKVLVTKLTAEELSVVRSPQTGLPIDLKIGSEIKDGTVQATMGHFSYYFRVEQDEDQLWHEASNEKIGVRRFQEPERAEERYSLQEAQYNRLASAQDRNGKPFSLVKKYYANPKENIVIVEHIEESSLGIQSTWGYKQISFEELPERAQIVLEQVRELFFYAINNVDPVDFSMSNLRLQGDRCILCDFQEDDDEMVKIVRGEKVVDRDGVLSHLVSRLRYVVQENRAITNWFLEVLDKSLKKEVLGRMGLEEWSPSPQKRKSVAVFEEEGENRGALRRKTKTAASTVNSAVRQKFLDL